MADEIVGKTAPAVTFMSLGASDDIGASCHYLQMNGTGLLLDVGQNPDIDGPKGLPEYPLLLKHPDFAVDFALLSHAHHDHIGSIPVMLRLFPHVPIYMTPVTATLLDLLLPSSARLQQKRLKETTNGYQPLFDMEEAVSASYRYKTQLLNKAFELKGVRGTNAVKTTFFHAGHVLGAVGTLLETEKDGKPFSVFYTSDINIKAQSIQPGADLPETPVDVLIMESTLGADPEAELTTRKLEEDKFLDLVRRTLERGGSMLIPVFSLGRSQEMLAMFGKFFKQKKLKPNFPIYTAGGMRGIADVFDKTRFSTPRLDEQFEVFSVQQKRLPKNRSRLPELLTEPSVLLLSSGMLFPNTPSNDVAQEMVSNEKNSIALVGFAKPGCPAHTLLETRKKGKGQRVVLDERKESVVVNCEVEKFRFTGHSNRQELLQVVAKLRPKTVILVHGETEARLWLKEAIAHFYPDTQVILPEIGKPYAL